MLSGDEPATAVLFEKVENLRHSILQAINKADVDLRKSGFDELVTFFSR
jgi:hypothetical protein